MGAPSNVQRLGPFGADDGELDLRGLGAALWRQKWKILAPTLAVAAITLIVVQFLTPRYVSEARVFIEGRENIFLRPEADKQIPDRGTLDQEAVTSQVQLVLSRDLAREVIRQLKLAERPEFDPVLRGVSPLKVMLALLGFAKDPLRMTPQERVLESYYDRLSVFPVDKSRVIAIGFQSQDPELATRIANAIAEGYLGLQQVAKQTQARAAGHWLSGEIESLRKKVVEAEAKVEQFRAKSNLLLGANNTTLSNQQLAEFNSQLAAARAQMADAEVRARLIRETLRSGRVVEASEILNSELIRRLFEQRMTARAQLAEQSTTLLDGHPRIKELRAQTADLERQLRAETELLARALESDARIAGARVESLSAGFDQLKRQAALTNEQDVQLRAFEREAKAQRDLLESYLAKYRETAARDTIDTAPADARVISRASVSNIPAFPKKLPIVLIATLAMFALSSGFVTTRELMGMNAGPRADVTVVPPARRDLFDGIRHEPRALPDTHPATGVAPSALEEIAQDLRRAGEAGRRIAVVDAVAAAATLPASLALARTLAKQAKVVLVDLAGCGAFAGISSDPGAPDLADLVRGAASFGHIITKDRQSRVHLIMAGEIETDRATLLASQRLVMTFDALARTYDHVVIHAGAAPGKMAAPLAQLAARAVLVAEELPEPAIAAARSRLSAAGFVEVTTLAGVQRGLAAA